MNKYNAHEYLPLVQALADGKTIQIKTTEWEDFEEYENIKFDEDPSLYRVKPKPRTFEVYRHKSLGTMITTDHYEANNYAERFFYDYERITVQEVL